MIKFKSRSARTKFKFKSKLATRVKFKARGVYKSREPKRICLAHATTYRKRLPAHYVKFREILASRSRIASSNAAIGWIVNLNYKELNEAKFKIPPP